LGRAAFAARALINCLVCLAERVALDKKVRQSPRLAPALGAKRTILRNVLRGCWAEPPPLTAVRLWSAGFGAITRSSQSRARQFQTKIERLFEPEQYRRAISLATCHDYSTCIPRHRHRHARRMDARHSQGQAPARECRSYPSSACQRARPEPLVKQRGSQVVDIGLAAGPEAVAIEQFALDDDQRRRLLIQEQQ
jgi:hypothetical protein